jgi:hypothetical protein
MYSFCRKRIAIGPTDTECSKGSEVKGIKYKI